MNKPSHRMYKSAKLHIGVDTLKFKLELINSDIEVTDTLDLLKDKLRTALNEDEIEHVRYISEQKAWLIFTQLQTGSEYPNCRFYYVGKCNGDLYVELYGMFQSHDGSLLKLSETHATILELLSDLRFDFNISITKIDLSIDYFYNYKKSYIWFYSSPSKENDINKIKKQNDHDISYRGRFPMHTIEAPTDRSDILNFIKKNNNEKKIKRKYLGEKRPEGSYYRFGTFKSSGVYKSFAECEENDDVTTHVQLKINDKNLFFEVKKLFKGKENWSYDFDETEDIKLSASRPKITWINYDRTERDINLERQDDSEEYTHKNMRMEYANNDEEIANDLSHIWRQSRLELKLLKPGVKRERFFDKIEFKFKEVTPPPLDALDGNTYKNIFEDLEGRIKPITIVLIRANVPNGVYVNHCRVMQTDQKKKHKESQKKLRQKKGEEFEPTEFKPEMVKPKPTHGRILKPIDFKGAIKSELDIIKSFFI